MNWEAFYLICFGVGLALSVVSFAGGFGHVHFGHLHVGHVDGGSGHGAAAGTHGHAGHGRADGVSAFNMFTAMAFLCWFGGAGYLLTHYRVSIVPVVFALAVAIGVIGAGLIFGFLVKVLLPHERTLLPEDTEMRGVVGRVSSPLRADGLGEILFSLDGTRRCAAAKAEDGQAIARDAQVLVMRYEQGVAWVRPFNDLEYLGELDAPEKPG
jgi:hypothetical protein